MINSFRDKILMNGLAKEQKLLREKLVYSLFKDFPNLKSLSFSKTNEYDDNNYYDSARVDYINGVELDVEEYAREGDKVYKSLDGDEIADEQDILDDESLEYVINTIKEYIEGSEGYGDYELNREEVLEKQFSKDEVFNAYYQSYLSGKRAECEEVFSKNINIAICYAYDILKGRLDSKIEKKLEKEFKKDIFLSYLYAVYCIKGRLPSNVDNYFTLKSFKDLNSFEKKYLNLYKEFVNSHAIQKV